MVEQAVFMGFLDFYSELFWTTNDDYAIDCDGI